APCVLLCPLRRPRRPHRPPLLPYPTLFRSRTASPSTRASPRDRSPVPRRSGRSRSTTSRCSANCGARASSTPSASTTNDPPSNRSEEHTSELQSREKLVCRLLLEKKNSEVD